LLLSNGNNTLDVNVPSNATAGNSWARFRYSSTGSTDAFGAAVDGEVEDYRVVIAANPFQNGVDRFDVSGDGFVSAIDALQLVNFLNANGSQRLPTPPGMLTPKFPDVDGNGFINANDVLNVINYLNSKPVGEGEGQAEGEGSLEAAYGVTTLLSAASLSTPSVSPLSNNRVSYTELRLADYMGLTGSLVAGPSRSDSAVAWWDEAELVSESFVDDLASEVAEQIGESSSHDEWFADLGLEL
jgi:hypothetical protein